MRRFLRPSGSLLSLKASLLMVAMLVTLTPVHAVTLGFQIITDSSEIASTVGGQLSVDVQASGTTAVAFKFKNSGPIASSITDIYFANSPALFSDMTIFNSPGVKFSAGASPPALPGGDPYGLGNGAIAFAADSDAGNPGVQANGVNPGDTLAFIFTLMGGSDFDDVINALLGGTLRIGIHVQAIDGDSSASYIAATPLPGAIPLFATGLAALGLLRWRTKRKSIAQ